LLKAEEDRLRAIALKSETVAAGGRNELPTTTSGVIKLD
jgi:hypothetical protein